MTDVSPPQLSCTEDLQKIHRWLPELQDLVAVIGDEDLLESLRRMVRLDRQLTIATAGAVVESIKNSAPHFQNEYANRYFLDLRADQVTDPAKLLVVRYANSLEFLAIQHQRIYSPSNSASEAGFRQTPVGRAVNACHKLWRHVRRTGKFAAITSNTATAKDLSAAVAELTAANGQTGTPQAAPSSQ